jgi:hypothetical protein
MQSEADRPTSRLGGWAGFWLWALVGAGIVFGVLSFIVVVLLPMVVIAIVLARRSRWTDGPSLVGLLTGAGLPFLLVAGANWSDWNHRSSEDLAPNPYYWGSVGLSLLAAGVAASVLLRRRAT